MDHAVLLFRIAQHPRNASKTPLRLIRPLSQPIHVPCRPPPPASLGTLMPRYDQQVDRPVLGDDFSPALLTSALLLTSSGIASALPPFLGDGSHDLFQRVLPPPRNHHDPAIRRQGISPLRNLPTRLPPPRHPGHAFPLFVMQTVSVGFLKGVLSNQPAKFRRLSALRECCMTPPPTPTCFPRLFDTLTIRPARDRNARMARASAYGGPGAPPADGQRAGFPRRQARDRVAAQTEKSVPAAGV